MTRELLGALTLLLATISCVPYVRDIFRGRTKPHAFSWLIWSMLTGIAFGISVTNNGGAGSWQLGFTAATCAAIFLLSFRYGEKDIRPFDWWCLAGAGAAGAIWLLADGAVFSVIMITIIDAVGALPTFRKSFRKPQEETLSTHAIDTAKHSLSLFALNSIALTTTLYPASLLATNGAFVAFLIIRRRQLQLYPA